jgi:hypothetical protein
MEANVCKWLLDINRLTVITAIYLLSNLCDNTMICVQETTIWISQGNFHLHWRISFGLMQKDDAKNLDICDDHIFHIIRHVSKAKCIQHFDRLTSRKQAALSSGKEQSSEDYSIEIGFVCELVLTDSAWIPIIDFVNKKFLILSEESGFLIISVAIANKHVVFWLIRSV